MYMCIIVGHAKPITCIHADACRIAPRASMHPGGCRSCMPRLKCAPSCAQMMRRALRHVMKRPRQCEHFSNSNCAILPMSYLQKRIQVVVTIILLTKIILSRCPA